MFHFIQAGACANSVVLSPKLDSPKSIVAITTRLGYGRLGRRASRSLADLNALSSYQQQRFGGRHKFYLRNIPSGSVEDNNQSYDESDSTDVLHKAKPADNMRIKSMREAQFQSFDK